jgi:release factor glutamine methyltransferase
MRAGDALRAAATRIDRLDAEVLLAQLLGTNRMALLLALDRDIDEAAFKALVDRRAAGEPVAYITGSREFWSLDLTVTPDVLIPRPDSETLIEAALAAFGDAAPQSILDLGTGSGALLLAALDCWPAAFGVGVDRFEAAARVARGNAMRLGKRAAFIVGDWATALDARFELVLANPPYVETEAELARDVRDHEPASALFAGEDGLDAYRVLVPTLPALIADGGVALLEIGATQADAVAILAAHAGLSAQLHRDLADNPRCLALRRA